MTESDGKNIREFYLQKTQELIDEYKMPVVLKTDLFNESQIVPGTTKIIQQLQRYERIDAIEIDKQTYEMAEANLQDNDRAFCWLGSICDLPFNDETFDIIVDLSTLDHVLQKDCDAVLEGYARVLKQGGSFLLFIWVGGDGETEVIAKQYCYNEAIFIKSLIKYFIIEETGLSLESSVLGQLKRYKCKVKK